MSEEFNTEVASIMIRQALEDLGATESKEYFEVDMNKWVFHENRYEDEFDEEELGIIKSEFTRICKVCFAGSVMSNRLGVFTHNTNPSNFDLRTRECLRSLDDLRQYHYHHFSLTFYSHKSDEEIASIVDKLKSLSLTGTRYSENAQQFKENMNKIADKLEELGL